MSNFGVNPTPVIGTSTGAFPQPVLPTPAPSSGLSSTVQNPGTNLVLNAAAGPKCNIVWVNGMDEVLAHLTSPSEEYMGEPLRSSLRLSFLFTGSEGY